MIREVTPRLFRGTSPEKFLSVLKAQGITDIISLRSGFSDVLDGHIYSLARAASEYEIEVTYLPQGFIRHPTEKETAQVIKSIDWIMLRPSKIYIHCAEGVDRTGWMVAAYRVTRHGYSVEDAIKEWIECGHHRFRYFWWASAFRKMFSK